MLATFRPLVLNRPIISNLLWTGRPVTDLSIFLTDASLVSAVGSARAN